MIALKLLADMTSPFRFTTSVPISPFDYVRDFVGTPMACNVGRISCAERTKSTTTTQLKNLLKPCSKTCPRGRDDGSIKQLGDMLEGITFLAAVPHDRFLAFGEIGRASCR